MAEEYTTIWGKYACKIEDGIKIVKITTEPTELYNPFNSYTQDNTTSLHIQFASIDVNDPKNILDFINKFGFLGLDIRNRFEKIELELGFLSMELFKYITGKENIIDNKESLISTAKNMYNITIGSSDLLSHHSIHEESLDDISYEITRLKDLLTLIEKKDSSNPEQLYELIYNASDHFSRYLFERDNNEQKGNLDILKSTANDCIMDAINKEIQHVSPLLVPNASSSGSFDTKWNSNTLISTIYTMLYLDLIVGKRIKKCKNLTCGKFFDVYGANTRKKFCTTKCAQSNASREYRKREKEGKVKNNGSN
ncbi:CGNR zinc finger domain-containing protein [Clostridium estertheticum]|uniref:CGNR zinc finger domain-containing protein n=1 Tax=Clostridium estertheticum TaxID=238834 RepID=UPI001C0D8CEB|nr:CGNR zinc finger domain-containing protein [Clostridium estertheticum]MBU3075622.1 hypothetical protein [Clostridium estertheticum]MBU3164796.1 hypothetical protein [Clostridium estertheticum]